MKNKENIKTVVLWLLFFSTIALVIIRYDLINTSDMNVSQKKISDRVFNDVIIPDKINIKLQNYDNTSILLEKDVYYDAVLTLLHNAFIEKTNIKQIDKDAYEIAKKEPNITLIYSCISSRYIEKSLNLKKTPLSTVEYIKKISIMLSKKEIYVEALDSTYLINVEKDNVLPIIEDLEKTNYTKYYTKLENINDNNDLLLPLTFYLSAKNIYMIDVLSTKSVTEIARNIFVDRFDFTSSMIQKNGIYFYSYNNGQEILKIHPNSLLEYKRESVQNVQDDLYVSTNEMLNFLFILGIEEKDVKIKSLKKIRENSKAVYEFVIKRQKDGVEIDFATSKEDGIIRVIGDSVVYANIMLKNIGQYGKSNDILEATKALNNNIEYIQTATSIKDVSHILKNIKNISFIYSPFGNELYPTYSYEIGDFLFLINAVNGDIYAVK